MRGNSHDVSFAEKGRHKVLLGVATFNSKTKLKELLCTTKEIVCVDSLTWLAVENRKIQEIAEKFAYKRFPGDSALLNNMNYADEEMAYNKKGLNGALVAAELKKIVDDKIASKTKGIENLAVNEPNKEVNKEANKENALSVNTATTTEVASNVVDEKNNPEDNSSQKYLKPIMDTLMNIKEEDDVSFKVHLGTSKTAKDTTLLNAKGITGIEEKKINDEYQYTYGNEKKIKDIEKYYDKTIKAGIEGAVVVGYKNDSIIGTQSKNITKVDFDNIKTKEDSLRIDKNIEGKNALTAKTSNEKLTAEQLRAKADKLLLEASSENLKAADIKTLAASKPEREKDSLVALATIMETQSQNKKIEASALNQKANNLDFDKNSDAIDNLLTNLAKVKPAARREFEQKESVIDSLKTESEISSASAKQIPDKLEKIAALNSIEKKEEDLLLKQKQLIDELKLQSPNYAANTKTQTDATTNSNTNSKLTSSQLRAKANALLVKANDENLKASDLRTLSADKPPVEKDSLVAKANVFESNSQKNKIEAINLNQKANSLDYNQNEKTISGLLTKLNLKNPTTAKELSLKNTELKNLEKDIKTQREEANKISDNLEKIAALNLINEKENDIILRQEQLISDIKNSSQDSIVKNTSETNSNPNKENNTTNTENTNTTKETSNQNNSTVVKNNTNANTETTANNNSSNSKENSNNENETSDFIAISDIQKTNMEYLEDFGDLAAEDLEFKVQVGVFKKRTTYNFPKLRGLGKVSNERLKDGSTRMTMGGSYKTLRQAFRHNKRINRAGQKDAFVSVYYKGQRIGIENLRRKGVLVKTQVVHDSVSETKVTINSSNLKEYAQIENENDVADNNENATNEPVENEKFAGTSNTTEAEDNFVFVPRTNIQKKTVFYAEKYGNISADGLEFKVQIAIFKYRSSYSFPKLKSLGKIETENAEEGGTRMTIGGSFKTLNEALDFNKKVVKAGQTDSFVALYYQSKRIYLENLERKGIFTSVIKVDKAD